MFSYLIIKLIVKTQNKEPPRHREGSSSQINEFYNSPGTGKIESRNRYQIYNANRDLLSCDKVMHYNSYRNH